MKSMKWFSFFIVMVGINMSAHAYTLYLRYHLGQATYLQETHAAGDRVVITAISFPGYDFKTWQTSDPVQIDSLTSATTTITMPAQDARIDVILKSNLLKINTPVPGENITPSTTYRYSGGCNFGYTVRINLYANGTPNTPWAYQDVACSTVSTWTWDKSFTGAQGPGKVVLESSYDPLTANESKEVSVYFGIPTYPLTVINGSGSGTYAAGTNVVITASAPATNQAFVRWSGATVAVPTNSTTTLIMPATATTVTATYQNLYHLTVTSGTGSGYFPAGAAVIAANPAPVGQFFDHWASSGPVLVFVPTNPQTVVVLSTGDASVTAIYKNGGHLTVVGGSGEGNYVTGTTVTIVALSSAKYYPFDHWESSPSISIADIHSATTTLIMPAKNVIVTSRYRIDLPTVTITNPVSNSQFTSGQVIPLIMNIQWHDPIPTSDYRWFVWLRDSFGNHPQVGPVANISEPPIVTSTSGASVTMPVNMPFEFPDATRDYYYQAYLEDSSSAVIASAAIYPQQARFSVPSGTRVNGVAMVSDATWNTQRSVMVGTPLTLDVDSMTVNGSHLYKFTHWSDGPTSNPRNLNMPATTFDVSPIYEEVFPLTVSNGSGSGVYVVGSSVTVDAPNLGASNLFDHWQTTGITLANPSNPHQIISMPANAVTMVAVYQHQYQLTVVDGTGSGAYPSLATVTISANPAPAGKVFGMWSGATVLNPASPTTTLVMPSADTTVTAVYVDSVTAGFTLILVNGTSGANQYLPGNVVSVTADPAPAGMVFDRWDGNVTVADPHSPSTTFVMPSNNVVLTALYKSASSDSTVGETGFERFPNATNGPMDITFKSDSIQHAELKIFDTQGRFIKTLFDGTAAIGSNPAHWDGKNDSQEKVASDLYLLVLKIGGHTLTKKIVVLR